MAASEKLLKYFNQLTNENQDYLLYQAIELYNQQKGNERIIKKEGKIIFVDFQKSVYT